MIGSALNHLDLHRIPILSSHLSFALRDSNLLNSFETDHALFSNMLLLQLWELWNTGMLC